MSDFMVTAVDNDDYTFEQYNGDKYEVEFPALGKNLLKAESGNDVCYSPSSQYNHYTINSGSVTTNGNTVMGFVCKCDPSTTYTFSFTKNNSVNTFFMKVYEFVDAPSNPFTYGSYTQIVETN